MECGEKVSLCRFGADQKIASSLGEKNGIKSVLMHSTARATSYCLLPDRLRASENAFKIGSVKFANSLSPTSVVKLNKVRTGGKSGQGT